MEKSQFNLPELPLLLPQIPLDRDLFLRSLIGELSQTLQDVVGVKESEGFLALVGQRIGFEFNALYQKGLGTEQLSAEQVAQVLVDVKRRVQGAFYVVEQTDEKIVLGNTACPFEEKVKGRPALCMMTSNMFGTIAGENLDYAKVELQQTIAQGDAGCRVIVHIKDTPAARSAGGREYFRSPLI